jgi:tetratricopeptide (TPR) repeat protein
MNHSAQRADEAAGAIVQPAAAAVYDVFLSYSRADSSIASEINDFLRAAKLKVFFDRNELLPGRRWMDDLEKAIGASRSAIVLVGPNGLGNTQQYERQLALIRHAQEPTFPVIPTLLPGTTDPPASFLNILTWVDLRDLGEARNDPEKKHTLLQALVKAVSAGGTDTGGAYAALCPYRGLDAFREEDAALYFGRGSVNDPNTPLGELVRKIGEHNFVAIVGRSGSGKSSLVFAGLLPTLRQRRDQFWDIVSLRPGADPLRALAEAFNPPKAEESLLAYADRISKDTETLRKSDDPQLLKHLVNHHLKTDGKGNERLLLYVDQWEELYAQAPRPEDRDRADKHRSDVERFTSLLLAATESHPDRPAVCTVVTSVRADFYDHLIRQKQMAPLLPRQQVNIGAMSKEELRRTIVEPAAKAGLTFDPATMVNRIIEETGQDEGMLPLLQYALKETWANRDGNRLTAAAYEQAGGVKGAIIKTADKAFAALSPAEQHAASQLFLRLVSPGEGQEDSRIRAAKPSDTLQQKIVEQFSGPRVRLVVTGSDSSGHGTIEVAHEALIRTWPRLRSWIDDNRSKLRARAAILQSKNVWDSNGKRADLLLRSGYEIERARELMRDPGDVSVEDVKDYVEQSEQRENRARLWNLIVMIVVGSLGVSGIAFGIAFLIFFQQARSNFQQAQTNLHAGANALSTLTDVIDKRLLPTARVAEVDDLMAAAQSAVKQFPEEAAADPSVALGLARLKLTFADLEKLRKLGNAPTVLNDAKSAVASLEQVLKTNKDDKNAQFDLAHGHLLIGFVLTDSDPPQAKAHLQTSVEELRALVAPLDSDKTEPYWVQELCLAEQYLGDLLIDRFNDTQAAKDMYDQAQTRLQALRDANPKAYGVDRNIAWAINKHGDVLLRDRDTSGALHAYQDARDRLKQIETAGHLWDDPTWVYSLIIIDNNIAILQRDQRDYDDAIQTLKEAYADVNELVHHHDQNNLWWKGTLGWTLDNEGWVYFLSASENHDRLELARTTLSQALQIRSDLLNTARQEAAQRSMSGGTPVPENPLWLSDTNFSAANLDVVVANEMRLAGQYCAAAQKFDEAAELNKTTTARDMEGQALFTMQILDWAAAANRNAGDTIDEKRELTDAIMVAGKYIPTTKLQAFKDKLSAIQGELAGVQPPSRGNCAAAAQP